MGRKVLCFICGLYLHRHTPEQLDRCNNTPLDLRVTDQGRARIRR